MVPFATASLALSFSTARPFAAHPPRAFPLPHPKRPITSSLALAWAASRALACSHPVAMRCRCSSSTTKSAAARTSSM